MKPSASQPPKQTVDERIDKVTRQLTLMRHYNLECAKNRRTGKTSKLETELKAELDAMKTEDAREDQATLKRLTAERRKRLRQPRPPQQ